MMIIMCGRELPYDKALLERYRKAVDRAVQLATIHNIQPISGTTVILCDLRPMMQQPCTSAKGLGKPRTVSGIMVLRNSYVSLPISVSCINMVAITYLQAH